MTAEKWISKLELTPHPEGGFFKEVYRSTENILQVGLPARYNSERTFGTSIYFLLRGNDFSSFHKLKSDETWHFYDGCSITIYMIDEEGNFSSTVLGKSFEENVLLQFTIPRNNWFAAKPNDDKSFSLVGCSVYPGFDFQDFELANREELLKVFPQHNLLITNFTKG